MNTYRYTLEPYKGIKSRYTCPSCGAKHRFTRYVDTHTGEHLADYVGRCDREVNCGYHYTPKQYFAEHPDALLKDNIAPPPKIEVVHPKPSFHTVAEMKSTLKGYKDNHLMRFLRARLGNDAAKRLAAQYYLGTSSHWDGGTVFWQIDNQRRIHAGKVMLYYPHTGRRVKEPHNLITWMHKVLGYEHFQLRQCLFGEHLAATSTKPLAIVESEKTAIIASHYMTEYTWMAAGSISNLTPDKCKPFENKHIMLFPDVGAYDRWCTIAAQIPYCEVSDILERIANDRERREGYDIADYLLER